MLSRSSTSVRHEYRNLVFEWNGVLVKFWSRMEWNTENLEYYSSIWSVFLSITRVPEKVDIQKIFRNTEKNYIRVVFEYRKKNWYSENIQEYWEILKRFHYVWLTSRGTFMRNNVNKEYRSSHSTEFSILLFWELLASVSVGNMYHSLYTF